MRAGSEKYIKEIDYKTADDFLKAISYGGDLHKELDHKFIFRGHSSDKYQLLPYLLREGAIDSYLPQESSLGEYHPVLYNLEILLITAEYNILQTFFDIADRNGLYLPNIERLRSTVTVPFDPKFFIAAEKWLPEELWEVAALAQHYGLPTRLLDWSLDLYVSLYFATQQALYESPKTEKDLLMDDAMCVKRALLRIRGNKSETEDSHSPQDEPKIELWAMNYKTLMAKSVTKVLKDFKLEVIRPSYSGNPNLAAQLGLFTLWKVEKKPVFQKEPDFNFCDRTPLDKLITDCLEINQVELADPIFYRITLPRSEAASILGFLFKSGYNAAKLFPGYGGVSKAVQERRLLSNLKRNTVHGK